jgi:NAD(P)-dependent dehydrogenase (short-subunit alcohol dehydrogenase family)
MDRIAMVSGADRGLGLALTVGLLEKGWRVFAGQYMPEWPALGEAAALWGVALTLMPLDVGDTASTQAAAAMVAAKVDRVDLLISNAGIRAEPQTLGGGLDHAAMAQAYNVNALGGLRLVEAFLPLADRSPLKRLCFVSSEAGSIALAHRTSGYGYCMSKTALNMIVKLLFNSLRPEGYTFRLYHPGWIRGYMSGAKSMEADMEPEAAALPALAFFTGEREDEDRLVMVDYLGGEWPF